jgi:predicted phosphodiesterase
VWPDTHFPLHDKKAFSCALKALVKLKPDMFIQLGDIGEWESASHWRYKRVKRPPLEYQLREIDKEVKQVNRLLDRIDDALDKAGTKEKVLTQGNHDKWLDDLVLENPYLKGYTFKEAIRAEERGYEIIPTGEYYQLGKLLLYHGHHFAGVMHTRNHLLRLGADLMYGHAHDVQRYTLTQLGKTINAWSIGCLKDLSNAKNEWLGGRPTNWQHAFAIVDLDKSGDFMVSTVEIFNGRAMVDGELIKG